MAKSKSYSFTIGLLYPGILGSIIYSVLDGLSSQSLNDQPERYILVLFILGQFIMDYLYTATEEIESNYTKVHGIFDTLIVLALFSSITLALNPSQYDAQQVYIPLILALSKSFAFFWEWIGKRHDPLAKVSFFTFGIAYICVFRNYPRCLLILLLVLALDYLAYWKFEKIRMFLNNISGQIFDKPNVFDKSV